MVLSEIDRALLQRCLDHQPNAWRDFVDRFLGLVIHVINHTASARNISLAVADREDLAGEVFCTILDSDFAILRKFRGEASLSTYLTVISRRVVVREILKLKPHAPLGETDVADPVDAIERIEDREEVERLMDQLEPNEADVVRRYHLEGHSYQEISQATGISENTVGPTLSRARSKMRQRAAAGE